MFLRDKTKKVVSLGKFDGVVECFNSIAGEIQIMENFIIMKTIKYLLTILLLLDLPLTAYGQVEIKQIVITDFPLFTKLKEISSTSNIDNNGDFIFLFDSTSIFKINVENNQIVKSIKYNGKIFKSYRPRIARDKADNFCLMIPDYKNTDINININKNNLYVRLVFFNKNLEITSESYCVSQFFYEGDFPEFYLFKKNNDNTVSFFSRGNWEHILSGYKLSPTTSKTISLYDIYTDIVYQLDKKSNTLSQDKSIICDLKEYKDFGIRFIYNSKIYLDMDGKSAFHFNLKEKKRIYISMYGFIPSKKYLFSGLLRGGGKKLLFELQKT